MLNKKTRIGMSALCLIMGVCALPVALTPTPAGACSVFPAPVDISLMEVRHISGPAAEDGTLESRLDAEYAAWPESAVMSNHGSLMLADYTDESFRVEVR